MSVPALRKPKASNIAERNNVVDQQFMILTLKNGIKMVISSDTFHGIIMMGDMYKCVFCDIEMESELKENHKDISEHRKFLSTFPFNEQLAENLVRQVDKMMCYCTICNVTTSTVFVMQHVETEQHIDELNRAILRAKTYKPLDDNNNTIF